MLTIMLVIFVAAVPGTAALIFFKRAKREEDELLRVRESRAVAVLGGLLWAFALGMYLYCLLAPGRLYTTESGAVNVAVFLGMGLAFGAAALLTYFVKCTVATERGASARWAAIRSSCGSLCSWRKSACARAWGRPC